jgi:hypothetical protein
MAHFLYRFLAPLLREGVKAPIVEPTIMEPKLADRGKLTAEASIEIFDGFRVALHDPFQAGPRLFVNLRRCTPKPCEGVHFWLLFGGDQKNCGPFLTLIDSVRQVARTFLTIRLTIGYMRLGEQRAYCRHATPSARRATETSIGPSGGTRTRGIVALEGGKDLDVREDIAGADDQKGGSHFRNVLNCDYSNELHTTSRRQSATGINSQNAALPLSDKRAFRVAGNGVPHEL